MDSITLTSDADSVRIAPARGAVIALFLVLMACSGSPQVTTSPSASTPTPSDTHGPLYDSNPQQADAIAGLCKSGGLVVKLWRQVNAAKTGIVYKFMLDSFRKKEEPSLMTATSYGIPQVTLAAHELDEALKDPLRAGQFIADCHADGYATSGN